MAALLAIATVLLMTRIQLPADSLFFSALQNSGHVLVFCLLTALLLLLLLHRSQAFPRIGTLLIGIFLFGVGFSIEVLQKLSGRGFDYGDQFMNGVGILAGITLFAAFWFFRRKRSGAGLAATLVALLLLLAGLAKPLGIVLNKLLLPALPVLANFEEPGALNRFALHHRGDYQLVEAPAEWPGNDSKVLRAETGKHNRLRIQFLEPRPDWRGYDTLSFEVFIQDGKAGRLMVMLRDRLNWRDSDRIDPYLTYFKIDSGYTKISIPLATINQKMGTHEQTIQRKKLDLTQMQEIVLLLIADREPRVLMLDNITLE